MVFNSELMLFSAGGFALIDLLAVIQALRSYQLPSSAQPVKSLPDVQTPAFLFNQDLLVEASPSGAALIANTKAGQSDRDAVIAVLSRQLPNQRERIATLGTDSSVALIATDDAALGLTLTERQGLLRISLDAPSVKTASRRYDDLERASLMDDQNMLRLVARDTPQLIWTEDTQWYLTWANAAYLSYANRLMPNDDRRGRAWPGERLFLPCPRTHAPLVVATPCNCQANGRNTGLISPPCRRADSSSILSSTPMRQCVRNAHSRNFSKPWPRPLPRCRRDLPYSIANGSWPCSTLPCWMWPGLPSALCQRDRPSTWCCTGCAKRANCQSPRTSTLGKISFLRWKRPPRTAPIQSYGKCPTARPFASRAGHILTAH